MKCCFECHGTGDDLISHHVVPRSRGGTKTLFLCQKCHDIAHGLTPRSISISQLTKEALKNAKERGVKLGNPHAAKAWSKALESIKAGKQEFAKSALVTIREIESTGVHTLTKIADCLNKRGEKTARGGTWTATAVRRIIHSCGV